jgi:hypothetical protein
LEQYAWELTFGGIMLDDLDKIILHAAYARIERNPAKRVSGNEVWKDLSSLSPPLIPARLRRLISLGLLEKDKANSSSRTKAYAGRLWRCPGQRCDLARANYSLDCQAVERFS